jgi:preprotein translocase subunit SecD
VTGARLPRLVVCAIALVAAAGAAAASNPHRLDVTLRAVVPVGAEVSQGALDRSAAIMRRRLVPLGVQGDVTHARGSLRIILHFDGLSRAKALEVAKTVSRPGHLGLYDLEASLLAPSIDRIKSPVATTSLYALLRRAQTRAGTLPSAAYLFDAKTGELVAGPVSGPARREQLAKALLAGQHGRKPSDTQLLFVPAKAAVVTCNARTSIVCPGLDAKPLSEANYYYLFRHEPTGAHPAPVMSGADLKLAKTRQDLDPVTGAPIVTIQFTPRGDKLFQQTTRAEAERGRSLAAPQHFAVVLDNQIRSWPQIDYMRYPRGIDPAGNGAEISGLSSLREARHVAAVLATGALPVGFSIVR